NFMQDGYTDLTAMCERYAKEAVEIEDRLATIEEIVHVAKLLEQYMGNYIENKGGISKLELYTVEECDEIFYNSWEITLDAIKKFRK
ncbi:MAG: hypothetical protein GX825_06205, partial [Syntrophomonadaceae bacterium]|nr:hypothetical protein [Syntrophomonadaceae bacterium]